jgi:hypothetical protein
MPQNRHRCFDSETLSPDKMLTLEDKRIAEMATKTDRAWKRIEASLHVHKAVLDIKTRVYNNHIEYKRFGTCPSHPYHIARPLPASLS